VDPGPWRSPFHRGAPASLLEILLEEMEAWFSCSIMAAIFVFLDTSL
jgi:hypothetical protein